MGGMTDSGAGGEDQERGHDGGDRDLGCLLAALGAWYLGFIVGLKRTATSAGM